MSYYRPDPVAKVEIPAGTVVELGPGSRRWFPDPIRLRVTRVRHDLSRYYEDLVWLEGDVLDDRGDPVRFTQELVRLKALRCYQV